MSRPDARFGCSITPTREALGNVKTFLAEQGQSPLKPGQLDNWLGQLREKLGQQEIDVYGIDPRTRAGLVMIEADYRMKLVGMGLEEGVPGVPSYLSMVQIPAGQAAPPMDVLRWWFTLKYDGILTSADRNAFQLQGQGLQVLSENEMLTATGQRVHTGNSDELNRQFARNFTEHFRELEAKYPVYAELENLADLSLIAAILRSEELPEKAHWHMLFFKDPKQYRPRLAHSPKKVETVINHRNLNGVGILVGVSGGVRIDPTALVRPDALKLDDTGRLKSEHADAAAKDPVRERWWWD
jgi:hypothetical protein